MRRRNVLAIALLAFVSTLALAQISGTPTTRAPRLTVGPGPTIVQDLTVNGTCTGCGAGGAAVLAGLISTETTPSIEVLPAGWSVASSGTGTVTLQTSASEDCSVEEPRMVVSPANLANTGVVIARWKWQPGVAACLFVIETRDTSGALAVGDVSFLLIMVAAE